MHTLRQQLVLTTAVVFSIATLVILVAARWIVAGAMAQETARAGERSASLLSASLAPMLAESDLASIEELAQALVQRGDFSYVQISDARGTKLASVGPAQGSDAQGFVRDLRMGARVYGQASFGIARTGERQAAQQVQWQLLALCLGTLLLAAASQVLVARLLTKRLEALREGADRMAAGEPNVQIEASGSNELAQLAGAFNQMSSALSERFKAQQAAELSLQQANEALEQRVAQRTEHLEQTLARLCQTQDELVEAQKLASLGALVAGISHELNTPIGNAVTAASSLQSLMKDTAQLVQAQQVSRRGLSEALHSGEQMAGLVLRATQKAAGLISSFKRVAVDDSSQHRRKFDLREVLEDLVLSFGPGLKRSQTRVELLVPHGIELDSYPGPLDQVIGNLIQNAERHAFNGQLGGLVQISAQQLGERVELQVRDDGQGMTVELQTRIFEPFFTTKLGQGGSGLGLSIVRNMVGGLLGGHISVRSAPGQGCCFNINIPLAAPARPM
ncbi:sensor histidine kinase [Roseateles albus]|uniref:histidine kinase n=1 Tax=Roseateles albus TaxID=2987525 RepID=A0ABT5KE58_9BURK|nr:HAMP domain-containing sensor histidine kinase [Roseateles albus]MDC8772178.1 HAMP domain-containing sensor histidine kinase [Roseateles albus]